jgi:predicted RNase H-like HicB family nuclease
MSLGGRALDMVYFIYGGQVMELAYTYWDGGDGWLVGYLNDYPEHLTEGKDLKELEEMLTDVYHIRQEEEKRLASKRKNGILRIVA